jgi:hypothetical protein
MPLNDFYALHPRENLRFFADFAAKKWPFRPLKKNGLFNIDNSFAMFGGKRLV